MRNGAASAPAARSPTCQRSAGGRGGAWIVGEGAKRDPLPRPEEEQGEADRREGHEPADEIGPVDEDVAEEHRLLADADVEPLHRRAPERRREAAQQDLDPE